MAKFVRDFLINAPMMRLQLLSNAAASWISYQKIDKAVASLQTQSQGRSTSDFMGFQRLQLALWLFEQAVDLYEMGRFPFFFRLAYNKAKLTIGDFLTFRIESEVVQTAQGQLRGRKLTSALGRTFYRFLGIPYAKPPVGPLRFKDPQPPESWEGVRDALKEGSICSHFDMITGSVKGSEDCLFLNVYTPELPSPNFKPKAVLVWIHGGGFTIGSGNGDVYGPDFFLEEDVILVTLNYRLGALGFLSTGTEDVPGNAGLKDMVMALKWVRQNIAAFGGDPDRVCVFGESAGGAAVNYLLLSPLAKGLFSSAISQSGSALCPWAFALDPVETAFRLGKKFGCDTNDPAVLLEYLRKIPDKVLARKQTTAISKQNIRDLIPFAFLPCAEPEGPNAFITEHPESLLQKGEIMNVPYITGINQMEGIITVKQILDKRPPADVIDKDFERCVPRCLHLEYGSEPSKEAARRIKEFYFGDKPFNKATYINYINMTTDTSFMDAARRTTEYIVKAGKGPVYNYEFIYDGDFALFKRLINIDVPGPAHADELGYLFYVPVLGPKLNPNTSEMKITKHWVRLWTNFAKYGNPTPDYSINDIGFKWEPVTAEKPVFLEISEDFLVKTNMMEDRVKFWKTLHQTYSKL